MNVQSVDDERTPMSQLMLGLPVGLWLFSLGADVMYRGGQGPASWDHLAFFAMFAALVVALLTAVPGFLDQLAGTIPRREPSRRLALHLAVVGLYVVNLCVRACTASAVVPVALSIAGVTLLITSGWLGGDPLPARDARAGRLFLRAVRVEARRRRPAH